MLKYILLSSFLVLAPSSAIIVDDYVTAELEPDDGLDWNGVFYYNNASAVAVDNYWILTASHVAVPGWSNSFSDDVTTYFPQEVHYHETADLALVRVDKVLPHSYSLYTGYIPEVLSDPELPVRMIGYGVTGSVHADYWTLGSSGRGTRRWGTQEIEKTDDNYIQDGTTNHTFLMYFGLGDTANEAGAGYGDSGGGVFVKEHDEWKLAGVSIAINGGYNRTIAVGMPEYGGWVNETIPEPAVIGLISLSSLGFIINRSLHRHKKLIRKTRYTGGSDCHCDAYHAAIRSRPTEQKSGEGDEERWFTGT